MDVFYRFILLFILIVVTTKLLEICTCKITSNWIKIFIGLPFVIIGTIGYYSTEYLIKDLFLGLCIGSVGFVSKTIWSDYYRL